MAIIPTRIMLGRNRCWNGLKVQNHLIGSLLMMENVISMKWIFLMTMAATIWIGKIL